jgi:hypothetical protein
LWLIKVVYADELVIILIGTLLSTFLLLRGWFFISEAGEFKGLLTAAGLAGFLGLGILLVDLKFVIPADINKRSKGLEILHLKRGLQNYV